MKTFYIKYVYNSKLIVEADKHAAVKGRASLTHELIKSYDLMQHMQVLEPKICTLKDLRNFHNEAYMELLKRCNVMDSDEEEDLNTSLPMQEYGLGFDCPTWPGILDYACCIAGATISACEELCKRAQDQQQNTPQLIINWTGGWHHAQRDKAAGYCYVNDVVLGVLILMNHFKRILYLDLDVHHGDGVEHAFSLSKRVFTLSFHQYECGFYPGSGAATSCGILCGKGYSANFPYKRGIGGARFRKYFKRITTQVLQRFRPNVCVVQCGADAIVGDPLGETNLTPADLIDCVSLITVQHLPTVVLGGGGYNLVNASRFWTQLTAEFCGQQLSDDIPEKNEHFLQFGPDFVLSIQAKQHLQDENTDEELDKCAKIIEENLIAYGLGEQESNMLY